MKEQKRTKSAGARLRGALRTKKQKNMMLVTAASLAVLAVCMLIVLLYAVGLVQMLAGSFTSGASMWAVSTIAGALVLVVKYKQEKRAADEAEVEE